MGVDVPNSGMVRGTWGVGGVASVDPSPVLQSSGTLVLLVGGGLLLFALFLAAKSVAIVDAHEKAVLTVLGEYRGVLDPGITLVPPLVSTVDRYDVRVQTLDLPPIEARTEVGETVAVDAVFRVRVDDVETTFRSVEDYRSSVVEAARTVVQELVERSSWENLEPSAALEARLRADLKRAVEDWGIDVEAVEVEEIELDESSHLDEWAA